MDLTIPSFSTANVLVVGDVMLDRYWHGGTSRISPEAPVPVVHINNIEDRPGGAGNVALNIASLGSHASLLSITGDDEAALILEKKCQAACVEPHLQKVPNIPTVTKLRVISQHQQLIRLDFEEKEFEFNHDPFITKFHTLLENSGALILSDYGKGTLKNISQYITAAKQKSIPVLVDPKGKDFNRYKGASLLTPNKKEFESVVGQCKTESELLQKAQNALQQNDIEALLVTRGPEGMTLIRKDQAEFHLPARAREVYDVTGAGDTVIATVGAALAAGANIETAVNLANTAAGIVVGKLGAASVTVPELRRQLQKLNATGTGVMTEEQLLIAIEDAKAHGEKIVFTNGCFDILHAGHVSYLEEAKTCGHRLIVAVNDDDSVKRLKGAGRPINLLSRRMAVLAGLNAVDWVVSFSEDTPERLINAIKPNVLVKGGDYTIENIVGAQGVLNYGGEVKVLEFVDGLSTTFIVNRIQEEIMA